jgi:2-keto-3-deoxy-L-rhamnonate aldolase RhmA
VYKRQLDSGADGIIVPRVEDKKQAETLVSCCKFPPQGIRGCGTIAPLDYKVENWADALAWLNEQTMIVPQVESLKAIDALDDMLDVPGIDAILVGPLDLSINMGIPGRFSDPALVAAIERVIAVCDKHNVASGIAFTSPELVRPWRDRGMRFLVCGFDGFMLHDIARSYVSALRS